MVEQTPQMHSNDKHKSEKDMVHLIQAIVLLYDMLRLFAISEARVL